MLFVYATKVKDFFFRAILELFFYSVGSLRKLVINLLLLTQEKYLTSYYEACNKVIIIFLVYA